MADDPEGRAEADFKRRILDAALDEFRIKGVDGFTIDDVAERAGVDPDVISGRWHDWRVLLMDAQLTRARETIPIPNNGDLRQDLIDYARALSQVADTPQGRRWFHRNLPTGHDNDFSEVRSDFWIIRFREILSFMEQAAQRGEIRDGIDLLDAVEMFTAAIYFDVTFFDSPVRREYADQVLDILLHGILRKDE